jgi:NADPH:quinone reductase-like Zn-dependent oxidoreductase/malonyl CoA-acyl carrier protein transacylase/thioesterase domain-containing protein
MDPIVGSSVLETMFRGEESLLDETAMTQPTLFALEAGLAVLWQSWGVIPDVLVGHSLGEITAAYVAGVFSLEDAARLVAHRGRLMASTSREGGMAAVSCGEADVVATVRQFSLDVSVAGLNTPTNTVVSGSREALAELQRRLKPERFTILKTSCGNHSSLMDPILDTFEAVVEALPRSMPKIPLVSCLTGTIADERISSPSHWRRHIREPVRFMASVGTLMAQGCSAFLEVGPNPTLLGMMRECPHPEFALWLPSLRRDRDVWDQLLSSVADLVLNGFHVVVGAVEGDPASYRRLPIPAYPFQRERYWPGLDNLESFHEAAAAAHERASSSWTAQLAALSSAAMAEDAAAAHAEHDLSGRLSLDALAWSRSSGPIGAYCNGIARAAVEAWVASLSKEPRIRVLEVSAEAGDLSSSLLEVLPASRTEYVVGERSSPGAERSEGAFSNRPSVSLCAFDLERDAASQGISGPFDLVVASHVLHNARDVTRSLLRLRSLIRPGGMLILLEVTRPRRLFERIFGPTLGTIADEPLRGEMHLLSALRWEQVLENVGFDGTVRVPDDGGEWANSTQHVFIARNPPRLFPGRAVASLAGLAEEPETCIHPLLGRRKRLPTLTFFEAAVASNQPSWLDDHRVFGTPVFPGAGFVEMMLSAATCATPTGGAIAAIEDITFVAPLALSSGAPVTLQTLVEPEGGVQIFATSSENPSEEARLVASGRIRLREDREEGDRYRVIPDEIFRSMAEVSVSELYEALGKRALGYGPTFRGVRRAFRGTNDSFGELELSEALIDGAAEMIVHPALLDASLHLASVAGGQTSEASTSVPATVDRIRCWSGRVGGKVFCHAVRAGDAYDVRLLDESGAALLEVLGLRQKAVSLSAFRITTPTKLVKSLSQLEWRLEPRTDGTPARSGRWLVLADRSASGTALTRVLGQGECVFVQVGSDFVRRGEHAYSLCPARADHFVRLLREAFPEGAGSCRGIVHMWALDVAASPSASSPDPNIALTCGSLIHLAQALVDADRCPPMWIVTRGSRMVGGRQRRISVNQAPIWGAAGSVWRERKDMDCVRVDLDPDADPADVRLLADEIARGDAEHEDEVAFREGQRFVSRVVPQRAQRSPAGDYRIQLTVPGVIDSLMPVPLVRRRPGPDEVEVCIAAAGMNFRDVLVVLGMLDSDNFGFECAGTVVAVGEGVADLAVGDEVFGFGRECFSSYTTASAAGFVKKPKEITYEEAVTLPIAFLTAEVCLLHLAHLQPGEWILIHAASGGVGLAAIQVAKRVGARIIATAGSPEKVEYLKRIGIDLVFSSRSLSFADDVKTATGGRGVDVVLNSLAGEFVDATFSTLRSEGRFVEIGKLGLLTPEAARAKAPHVRYYPMDLRDLGSERREMLLELASDVAAGRLSPLPITLFSGLETRDAFRFVQQARHIGKVVVQMAPAPSVRSDATYVIAGGTRGLGLRFAEHFVDKGARHLVLFGRRAPVPQDAARLEALAGQGVEIRVMAVDIASAEQMNRAFSEVRRTMPPVRGVVQSAVVLDDGAVTALTLERFDKVCAPKIQGTWNLHQSTLGDPLEFFVVFSSVSSILTSPGQSNYAAACSFQDALCAERRLQGRPALGIHWGIWAEIGVGVGFVSRLESNGYVAIAPSDGVAVADWLLARSKRAQVIVMPIEPVLFAKSVGSWKKFAPLTSSVASTTNVPNKGRASRTVRLDPSTLSLPEPARTTALAEFVTKAVVSVMGRGAADRVDIERPLVEQGLDSLLVIELRSVLKAGLGADSPRLPAALMVRYPTIRRIAEYLAEEIDAARRPDTEDRAESPIVVLHAGLEPRKSPPLVLIHAADGGVNNYLELSRRLGRTPVIALQSPALLEGGRVCSTLEEMGVLYAQTLLRWQRKGPFLVAGWCMGGSIVLEVVKALRAAGERTLPPILIDAPCPPSRLTHGLLRGSVQRLLGRGLEATASLAAADHLLRSVAPDPETPIEDEFLRRTAEQAAADCARFEVGSQERSREAVLVNAMAFLRYRPMANGTERVLLFRSEEDLSWVGARGDALGWETIPGLVVETRQVPGDHFTILEGEGVDALVRGLGGHLGDDTNER